MTKALFLLCFAIIFCLCGCSGIFATDRNLSEAYPSAVKDKNMTLYYNAGATIIDVAVKNTGSAFMNRLSVAFICTMPNGATTQIYSLGNLKPYFNKKLTVRASLADCSSFRAEYTFIPSADGDWTDNGKGFRKVPVNSVEGVIAFK